MKSKRLEDFRNLRRNVIRRIELSRSVGCLDGKYFDSSGEFRLRVTKKEKQKEQSEGLSFG